MEKSFIDQEKIKERLVDIDQAIEKLKPYQAMSSDGFASRGQENDFALASYWLRIALEAVLTISTHILSRLPANGRKKDYTQVLLSLADYHVIPSDFAQKIKGMAGYRNRLVHMYWKIQPQELHKIIQDELGDFTRFIDYIKQFLDQQEHN